jgi:hypothetical protein
MLEDKEILSYWVHVKPQMIEGMTKGYEVNFNDFDDAKDKYDEFADDGYEGVELIEQKKVITFQVIEFN